MPKLRSTVSRAPTIAWLLAMLVPIAGWMILTEVRPARMNTLWTFHFADPRRERLFGFFGVFCVGRCATSLFGSLLLIGVHGWSFLGALAREAGLVGR